MSRVGDELWKNVPAILCFHNLWSFCCTFPHFRDNSPRGRQL